MKLVTASYFQEENWGPGKKIGISPGKPKDIPCDLKFDPLNPGDLYWSYMKAKKGDDPKAAGEAFVQGYSEQLKTFVEEVKKEAAAKNITPQEVLPLADGDTLLSWEAKGHMSFRGLAAEALRELGYDVEEN